MTRINLVPVQELTDQHLFAEFREIKMVPKSLNRSLLAAWNRCSASLNLNENAYTGQTDVAIARKAVEQVYENIPPSFTLGKGHVSFFYDKGSFLDNRYEEIRRELDKRGVPYNVSSRFDPDGHMDHAPWNGDYTPTPEALAIIRARIAEKIAMKPHWYRTTEVETA